ncbi:EAL domain-containing protein [Acidithiobacillus thiooxidans]|uniref:EAL domain-containing protein n=1 Tax=Acidithiobacillus thiooxidans TaxID=930 RepID=UPI001C0772D4|nr:EAL domain-containing protein [Acidithiobacillus thiooxidans]MBU2749713.1 EAL domain-containing protein [Acidithiobacillus thiooxidans]
MRTNSLSILPAARHGYRLEPLVELSTGNVIGYELLAGKKACPDYDSAGWRAFYQFLEREVPAILNRVDGKLFINLDGAQMLDPQICGSILFLKPFADRLVLEWTEQSFHDDLLIDILTKIIAFKADGFSIAVDDIGAGVDGMGRAHSCRPHFGKIDGQMLRRDRDIPEGGPLARRNPLARCQPNHLFIRGMVDSLRSHGAKVIVEWIETEMDRNIAIAAGAEYGQGYLWTRPSQGAALAGRGEE